MRRNGLRSALVLALSVARVGVAFADANGDVKQACVAAFEDGQRDRNAGKLSAARDALLRCAREECPTAVRKDCSDLMVTVDAELPSIVVATRDADGHDVVAAHATLDGKPLDGGALAGTSIVVDPGEHVIAVERDGARGESTIVVHEGEKNRIVVVTLATSATSSKPGRIDDHPVSTDDSSSAGGLPTLAWVLGGVSVVALGSFAYFGIKGATDASHMRSTCKPTCDPSDVDAVKTKLLIADVSLGVSVVSLGIATVLSLSSRGHSESSATAARVDFVPMAGGGVAFASGAF